MKVYRAKKASFALLTGVVFFILTGSIFGQNMFRKINDFDGDGKADYAVTRNIGGQKYWYVWKSASGPDVFQFGLDTDTTAAGDWDGDGKTDYSIYRRFSPNWTTDDIHQYWIYESSGNTLSGRNIYSRRDASVLLAHQDYTGDGTMDPGIAIQNDPSRPEPYINIINFVAVIKYYNSGNLPVRIGDLTGDGKSDIVSYNSFNLVTTKNYTTETSQSTQFGTTGDEYVPADFDGDGKGDLTIFRQSDGSWWWIRSSDNTVGAVQFGLNGDKPVPADYDGDGKTDFAIWRPGTSQSVYWVYGSMGNIRAVEFGVPTDTVVRY